MLGDFAVGKTSLIRRFVEGRFEDKYLSTIGVKVDRKTVTVPYSGDSAQLTMMLWDLAGSEKFNQMRANYMRGAVGAVLVCDVSRPETLAGLTVYADDLRKVTPKARFVLAANKADLPHEIPQSQLEAVANSLNAPYYYTSAKTGDTVEVAFHQLGEFILL